MTLINEQSRRTLMLAIHHDIEEAAENDADQLAKGDTESMIVYPPNGGFTTAELNALEVFKGNEVLKSAMRKILANSSATVIFHLLNKIDSTGDPGEELGEWSRVALVERTDDMAEEEQYHELLHDDFYATYWDWRDVRPVKDWWLDTLDD